MYRIRTMPTWLQVLLGLLLASGLVLLGVLLARALGGPTTPPTSTPVAATPTPGAGMTSTPGATATLGSTPTPGATGTPTGPMGEGEWMIQYFGGATDEMHDWTFSKLDPATWSAFPNVDNGSYPASQGLEYGEDLTTFCQFQETCDFVVPARHYRLYSGDYELDGVGSCYARDQRGCALMVVNVGEVTASFEDQTFDAGFTVWGRYWDGNYLPQAIWAGLSHVANNMMNLSSTLNPGGTNAGANCSVPDGCSSVEATFVVTSGNEILMVGRAVVSR